MSTPEFKTYWTIDEQRVDDIDDVAELVEAGHVAVETSVTQQIVRWQREQMLERWHRESLDRHAKFAAEAAHRDSPEGQRELVARHAAQHPGGIISGANHPAFDELDRYSPPQTNKFR